MEWFYCLLGMVISQERLSLSDKLVWFCVRTRHYVLLKVSIWRKVLLLLSVVLIISSMFFECFVLVILLSRVPT